MEEGLAQMTQNNNPKLEFTPPYPLKTAVLFLVFNRLDTTKQVFEAIRQAKPPRLYVAADGARQSRENEEEKVKAVRDYIISNINWECEVKTRFREQNLGCKYSPSEAIGWFFQNEKMGIILEDDCLPSQSFFWFCEELLEKYKDDMKVWHISGSNFQSNIKRGNDDYYFSKYNHTWGWASWANRWDKYDVELDTIKDVNFLKKTFENEKTVKYWTKIFHTTKAKKVDISWWDYQWAFTVWFNNGLAIRPSVNLISNIGFGTNATHTFSESEHANISRSDIVLTNYPAKIIQNKEADNLTFKTIFAPKPFFVRVIKKIKRIIAN